MNANTLIYFIKLMEMVYPIDGFGCGFLRISFAEWLKIGEPVYFGVVEELGDSEGLFIQTIPSLSAYLTTVAVVRVDGTLYKLNGSRRKNAWLNGSLATPDFLTAMVFDMPIGEFLLLHAAAKTRLVEALPPHELVKIAYAELGLVFVSERLRNGFITEAIHIALRGRQRILQDKRSIREREDIDMKKAIQTFKTELLLIDGLNPKADIFTTGVLAGALIMLGLGKPITEFLTRLNESRGEVKDGLVDPVESLLKAIHRHRITQKNMQPRMAIDLCKKTVHAIMIWLEGDQSAKYWRIRDLTGHELAPIIMEMKKLKMIHVESDL